jgi:hypothetical protein
MRTRTQVRTQRRLVVLVALTGLGASAACSLLSGLDELQKVDCVASCDGSGDGGPADIPDAATPDTGKPDAEVDSAPAGDGFGTPDASADAGDSGSATDGAHDSASPQDAADARTGADAGDASTTADAPNGADGSDAAASAYAAAVLADTPLAYWRLGDPSGSTTCVDQTGHGYAATVVGTITLGVPGALAHDTNTAAQVPGGESGYLDVGNFLDAPSPAAFSWEVWVKPTSIGTYAEFMSRMTYTGSGNPSTGTYMFAWNGAGMNLGFERWVSRVSSLALDTPGLVAGSWAHVVATVDGTGAGAVYVNGTRVGTGTTGAAMPATTAHVLFGYALPCVLDEIAIYDHALSAASVSAHYAAATQ